MGYSREPPGPAVNKRNLISVLRFEEGPQCDLLNNIPAYPKDK